MGDDVTGIFQELSSFDDINSTSLASDDKLLATGDNYGKVKIFAYPSRTLGAPFKVTIQQLKKRLSQKKSCKFI